jgi:crotonobetainyl-CoA:carnitine CoA-transferase CaiB-like acyl-CoA transferase
LDEHKKSRDAYCMTTGTPETATKIGVQNDRGWRALVTDFFERPDLVDHPRLATNPLRVAHREECDAVVAEHTRGFATADLDARLAAAGVPAAQINDMFGLVEPPQLSAATGGARSTLPQGRSAAYFLR